MDEYLQYEAFARGDYIPHEQMKKVTNFICGQLFSWSPNRSFYQAEYNLPTKLIFVCQWKKKKVCQQEEKQFAMTILPIFFEDEKHKNCICSIH